MKKTTLKTNDTYARNSSGFTLVELLLVITLISILAGAVLSTINYTTHKKRAEDAIKRETLYKLMETMEAYKLVEGTYPPDFNNDSNPSTGESAVSVRRFNDYFKNGWPNGVPKGATYLYDDPPSNPGIIVALSTPGRVLKWRPPWGVIKECASTTSIQDDLCP